MPSNPSPSILATLENLPNEMDIASVPGLVIAHVQGEEIAVHPIGVTHAETRTPVTPDTVFPAASLSKPVFALGVLRLVESGLFDLDRPLGGYLPLPEAESVPQLNEITARQVLSHATGLQNWRFALDEPFAFAFAPGDGFQYSGEGYFYLQRVVEKITGQGIEGFMQDHVLQPLGMRHSSYLWLPEHETTISAGHQDRGRPVPAWNTRFGKKMYEIALRKGQAAPAWQYEDVVRVLPELHPNLKALGNDMIPNVAASLLTTAADYAQFVLRILTAPPPEMLTPHSTLNRALSWGLGWGLAHSPRGTTFWHWGDNGAFKNFIYAEPGTKTALLIFTNGERGIPLCERIIRRVMGVEHPAFLWL